MFNSFFTKMIDLLKQIGALIEITSI